MVDIHITKAEKKLLKEKYYNPSQVGSLGGIQSLQRATGLPEKKVISWLQDQDVYTLHKPARRKFEREKIRVQTIDHQWEADLVELKGLSKANKDFTYILTVIDVLSKFAWVIPLKNKQGSSIVNAFENIFKNSKRRPIQIRTDKGGEFVNTIFQNFLKKEKIHFFTSNNETKAAVVERFNRTLKERMWKYFTLKNTRRYIDVLPQLVDSYNNSWHRSIKRKPIEVNEFNAHEVWNTLYGKNLVKPVSFKFKINDTVRISKLKGVFEKGYTPNWSTEIFRITKRLKGPKYKLCDLQGDPITGTFLEPELQKVPFSENKTYQIEKVLKRRGKGAQAEAFVKWVGYPNKFNSWVRSADIEGI